MGGFFYFEKSPQDDVQSARAKYARSLQALAQKGLSEIRTLRCKEVIERDAFVIDVYDKIGRASDNLVHFPGGDFVLATGAFVYRGRSGQTALRHLYADFQAERTPFNDLRGHFCVFIYKGGTLQAFTDYFGVYQVFTNEAQTVISNSFLALVRSLDTKAISKQGFFEYLSDGASYAGETYIKGVKLLDAFDVHELAPGRRRIAKRYDRPQVQGRTFDQRVDAVLDGLVDYATTLKTCFGDSACLGLSGGYDSRLLLALLLKVGVEPRVYTYGDERSSDVTVSKAIGRGEGIPIHHDNRRMPPPDPDAFVNRLRLEYFYGDGQGPNGAFTNGAEQAARAVRTDAADFQLNGGGGEVFRNFWKLPDKSFTVREFLRSRFDFLPDNVFTGEYDKRAYFDTLADKAKRMLRTDSERLTRRELEMLYIYMRVKYWMGYNTSIQNFRTFALIPLVEPAFAFPSWDIPMAEKNLGRFQAELIRRLNRRLAGYTSGYGFDFAGEAPWPARIKDFLLVNAPIAARPPLRRLKHRLAQHRRKPFFLRDDYVGAVLDRASCASEFVNPERIHDPLMLSRAYTVDLVMADPF